MKVALIGGGSWGVALASLLMEKGHEILWWVHSEGVAQVLREEGRHPNIFPDFQLPRSCLGYVGADLGFVLGQAEVIVGALPAAYFSEVFGGIGLPEVPYISATKGLVSEGGMLVSQYLRARGARQLGVLSGPSHAEEVIQGRPTWVACACEEESLFQIARQLLEKPTFHLLFTPYLEALEWVGVLKNIYAIGMGALAWWGDNARAALAAVMQRELYEVLAVLAPVPLTVFLSPGWVGDFLVTAFSTHSRNQRFGILLAQGYSPQAALHRLSGMVAEGYHTAHKIQHLPQLVGFPILQTIISVCTGTRKPQAILEDLNALVSR